MRSRIHPLWMGIALAELLLPAGVSAQSRWTVEGNSSLAWWQVNPNLNDLWATTCPADPDWRPGAGHSAGWEFNPALQLPSTGFGNKSDTVHVPLFPRYVVRHVCADAVQGGFTMADATHWSGIHGWLTVRIDDLVSGTTWRDVTMHEVLGGQGAEIRVAVDSVVDMTRHGDTLVGKAVGNMAVHGTNTPMLAAVRVVPDSGGLRVLVKWRISAQQLMAITPNLKTISLGLDARLWKDLFMGADLVLRPVTNVALGPGTAE